MTMKINEVTPRFVMTYEHPFSGVRYIDKRLTSVQWKLFVNMAGPEVSDNPIEQTKRSSVMYQKLVFFMDTVLNECVITGIGDATDIGHFHNIKVMIPELDPTDDFILQTLHSKLSTIAGEDMCILQLSLYASDTGVTYTFTPNGHYDLPLQEDFIGAEALHDAPWWARNDCDTYDVSKDHEDAEELLQSARVLADFEEHILEVMYGDGSDVDEVANGAPAEIIRVDQWQKPRKV